MRVALWIAVPVWLAFAALQYNDADGLYWAALYSAVAALTALATQQRLAFWAAAPATAACAVLFVQHWPPPGTSWWLTEAGNEALGLLLAAAWCALLAWRARRGRRVA